MRIALIWPSACTVYHTLPLSLGLLFDAIRGQGHEVRLFNLPLEGWTAASPEFARAMTEFAPDLIGATAWPMAFPSAVAAVRVARRCAPGAVCLLGGNYASLNPDQAWASGVFDYLMTGESERSFPEFVRLLAAGDRAAIERVPGVYLQRPDGTKVRNRNPFHADLDQLGRVDYDFIELDRAIARGYMSTVAGAPRKVAMFTSRGCEYACNFCTAPQMNGQAHRHYSVAYLQRELRRVYERHGVRMVYLMDDNALQDVAFFKDFCRGVIDLGLRDLVLELYRGVRLEALDPELLSLMKRANFQVVTIAPESGSERVRDLMHKEMASADIARAARMVKDAGLWLQAYFIVGYPTETAAERRQTYALIDALDVDIFEIHKYMALPGTASFLKLVRLGKIGRDHVDDQHFIGETIPNYNGDGRDVDREILFQYLRFYATRPLKVRQLLHLVSKGGIWRSFSGITRSGLAAMIPGARRAPSAPALRPSQ